MQGGDDEDNVIVELASILFSTSAKLSIYHISHQLTKGRSGARGDDTKSLKGSVLDWITPKGQNLICGFHHEWTGTLLCPAGLSQYNSEMKAKLKSGDIIVTGDQWPLFLYADYHYDPEDPWNDTIANLERFYNSVLDIFKDPDEKQEVNDLTIWWNSQIFSSYSTAQCPPVKNSALVRIWERQA
ncbi:hypothetical protein BDR04DRAFT_1123406 [Suillus decipiens]|nr:hypothetical protein BDR04DRAFT_1123406 [Suillus decipiens]